MLNWHTRQVNNIPTNPLDCYWAVGMIREFPRLYTIVEQYPLDSRGIVVAGSKPELYVLFEEIGNASNEISSSLEERCYNCYDGYAFTRKGSFVRAFKTLDEAKARAELQLKSISDIVDAYFPRTLPIEEVKELLSRESMREAVLIGTEDERENYYSAIVGIDETKGVVKYDYGLLVECFARKFGEEEHDKTNEELIDEAIDYVDANVLRAIPYWGEHAPIVETSEEDL